MLLAFAYEWPFHKWIFHRLFILCEFAMVLVLVETVKNLLYFHVNLVDMLDSRSDLTSARIIPELRMVNLFIVIGSNLGFHWIFHIRKFLHEVVILLTFIAESGHIIFSLPRIFLYFIDFSITTIGLNAKSLFFALPYRDNIRILQSISIWRVYVVRIILL